MSRPEPSPVSSRVQRDGRVARGNRTRQAIVQAHTELIRGGNLVPTAAQVADAAGVSVRTLWAAFGDMEGLLTATTGYWFEADDALRGRVDPQAPLETRIELFCAERVRRLENISPAARAALLKEPFSPVLRASRVGHVERVVHDIESAFASELESAPDPAALLDALVAATSWNAWSLLRDDLDRSLPAAHAAMLHTLRALLPVGGR